MLISHLQKYFGFALPVIMGFLYVFTASDKKFSNFIDLIQVKKFNKLWEFNINVQLIKKHMCLVDIKQNSG